MGTSKAWKVWSAVSVLAEHPKAVCPKLPHPLRFDRLIPFLPTVSFRKEQHPLGWVDAQLISEKCWSQGARQHFLYCMWNNIADQVPLCAHAGSWENSTQRPFWPLSESLQAPLCITVHESRGRHWNDKWHQPTFLQSSWQIESAVLEIWLLHWWGGNKLETYSHTVDVCMWCSWVLFWFVLFFIALLPSCRVGFQAVYLLYVLWKTSECSTFVRELWLQSEETATAMKHNSCPRLCTGISSARLWQHKAGCRLLHPKAPGWYEVKAPEIWVKKLWFSQQRALH